MIFRMPLDVSNLAVPPGSRSADKNELDARRGVWYYGASCGSVGAAASLRTVELLSSVRRAFDLAIHPLSHKASEVPLNLFRRDNEQENLRRKPVLPDY